MGIICALISYLINNRIVNELEDKNHPIQINGVTSYSSANIMSISNETYRALQVCLYIKLILDI